ncbi:peptidase MA family metallohydrolase [Mucilaginibacter aquatilis]|uniref:DUF1570 domain-containing protein n=1 Tax=Mucilaginibacter aquatilis TaxID=1517760 RepID=A0A6I4I3C8_9SPHI|nr:DUF1570 domain-containing protein [Mucilaginibacter aquatilis]MVN89520.1 DUF1570 domain-containing protein [Mucilaginibacter aquatilis]
MSRFFPAVFLCLFLTASVSGQRVVINQVGRKTSADDTAMLSNLIRYEAFVYNGLFDQVIPDSLPVVINLYGSRNDFLKERDRQQAKFTKTGFYSPVTRECYIYKGEDYQNVIVHEASHFFMHYYNFYGVPRWINEGMSTFFEGLYLDDRKRVYIDPQRSRLIEARNLLNEGKLSIPRYLSEANDESWLQKEKASVQYSIAYAIVYYIIKTNPQYIKYLLNQLNNGKNSADALSLCYGSVELFENRFRLCYRNFK